VKAVHPVVLITAILCLTLIALALIGSKKK
jgi:hypothetical protein